MFDANDPGIVLHRCDNYFFRSEKANEVSGQLNNSAFVEGMVYFKNHWIIYYVMGDSKIGVALCSDTLQ